MGTGTNLGEFALNGLQEEKVDIVNDLKVAGQEVLHKWNRPLLKSFWENGVVSVTECASDNLPSIIPFQILNINKYSLQFHNGECWMGVVKLNRYLVGEFLPGAVGFLESPHNIVQRCRHPEVLLLEPKLFPSVNVIVRVKDSRYSFSSLLVTDRSLVISRIKLPKVEFTAGWL